MKILVLNCGSSSLKYQLINMETETVMAKGTYERIGQNNSFLTHKVADKKYVLEHPVPTHDGAISFMIEQLTHPEYGVISSLKEIDAVGHRVVHGGEKFSKSALVTDEVIEFIKECTSLAPLHNPAALIGIEACKKEIPGVPMAVVFDTAFHQTMPKENYIYPIPYKYYEKYKIRKYGFHGTSHLYVSRRCAYLMNKPIEETKIVTCHLGQGASLCAVKGGKSVDTSMGLTPLAGIPMGTRCGDIDPSIVTYIMDKENLSTDEISKILNKESGVFGVSGVTPDFRDIEAKVAEGDERATIAIKNYNYTVAQYIAKYAVSMGGIDAIVFTAGVGENQINIRKGICEHLEFMGVKLDLDKNNVRSEEREISSNDSKIKVYIIPTDEEMVIAKDTMELVK